MLRLPRSCSDYQRDGRIRVNKDFLALNGSREQLTQCLRHTSLPFDCFKGKIQVNNLCGRPLLMDAKMVHGPFKVQLTEKLPVDLK